MIRLRFVCFVLLLSGLIASILPANPIMAQTPAEVTARENLAAEPEMEKIRQSTARLRQEQQLSPYDIHKQSNLQTMMQGVTGMKAQQMLTEQLHLRLEKKAEECDFCSRWQEELSELMRQELAVIHTYQSLYRQTDTPSALQAIFGLTPTNTRWEDRDIAQQQAKNAITENCGSGGQAPGFRRVAPDAQSVCSSVADVDVFKFASSHELAWSSCFKQHDWVESAPQRVPYESCMAQTDPLTKFCAAEAKARMETHYCAPVVITMEDVDALRRYRDRWITDPKLLMVEVHAIRNSPMHVTLLEPILSPVIKPAGGGNLANGDGKVRGRLDNDIPGATHDLVGHPFVVPAGTEVQLDYSVVLASRDTRGILRISVHTAVTPKNAHQALGSNDIKQQLPNVPASGTILIPAGTPFSFNLQAEPSFFMRIADFRERLNGGTDTASTRTTVTGSTATGASPAPLAATHPLFQGSRIRANLLESIDVSGARSGKSFHARLIADLELPRNADRSNAFILPRGTDLYLKVEERNPGSQFSDSFALFGDYAVVNGQKVQIHTHGLTQNHNAPGVHLPHSRQNPALDVLWAAQAVLNLEVSEQVEVPTQGVNTGAEPRQP